MNREERFHYAADCLPEHLRGPFWLFYPLITINNDWSLFYDEDEKWVKLVYKDGEDSILFNGKDCE